MEIFADPITINCRKVLAGLALMDVPYTLRRIDYFGGGHKAPDYVALNPNASIPALRDGGVVLWESNSILQYAADKTGATAVYPAGAAERADINRWMFWEAAQWFPCCYPYLVENCVKPLLDQEPDAAVIAAQDPVFHRLAGILDTRLAETGAWLCGAGPTLADIVVAAPIHLRDWQRLPLDRHPHLLRWMAERVETLPAWRATHVGTGFTLAEAA